MEFKKYSSIENHYQNKYVNGILAKNPEVIDMEFQITEKVDGCLDKSTLIETKEYGTVTIGWIVDNKVTCSVLSYNIETNEKEWDAVINFSAEQNTTKQWYLIKLNDDTEITITGNHKVWLPKKKQYCSVENLSDNDEFLLKR